MEQNEGPAYTYACEILKECDIDINTLQNGDYLFIIHSIIDSKLLDIDVPILDSHISKWNRAHEKKRKNKKSDLIRWRKTREVLKEYLKDTIEYVEDNELIPIRRWSEAERVDLTHKLHALGNNIFVTECPKKYFGAIDRCLLLGDRELEARSGERGGIIFITAGRND